MKSIQNVEFFENQLIEDGRGYFRRIFSSLDAVSTEKINFVQSSVSFNKKSGTVRGMHYQASPSNEWKYVTCLKGKIFDCLVDVRKDSSTYGITHYFEMSEEIGLSVLIPPGVAHGFQTQVDETYVHYQMTDIHRPELARRLLWNDVNLNIPWPLDVTSVSSLDLKGEKWPVAY
jgi:dTDP-4-dehydrorhamnose 3,5-epimerase